MKTQSNVLTHIQKPITMFGLPVPLLVLSVAIGLFGFVFCILSGNGAVSIIVFFFLMFMGFFKSYKLAKKDPHVVTVWQTKRGFWQGKTKIILLRGQRQ